MTSSKESRTSSKPFSNKTKLKRNVRKESTLGLQVLAREGVNLFSR